jgi:hypothetical protein
MFNKKLFNFKKKDKGPASRERVTSDPYSNVFANQAAAKRNADLSLTTNENMKSDMSLISGVGILATEEESIELQPKSKKKADPIINNVTLTHSS